MNISSKITQFLDSQKDRLLLWNIVFFALGSYLAILFFDNLSFFKIALTFAIFILAIFLYRQNESYKNLIFLAFSILFFGFLSSYFYQKINNNYTKITGKIFVDVEGRVEDFSVFTNKMTGRQGVNIVVRSPVFYKSTFINTTNNNAVAAKKISEKYIKNNYVNIKNYIDIDADFLKENKNYQDVNWLEDGARLLYPRPPKKITILSHRYADDLKIGDKIYFKATIFPAKKSEFVDSFDFALHSTSKGIGGAGYVSGEIEIIETKSVSNIDEFFQVLRKKIQEIILRDLPSSEGAIAAAFLMGNQSLIDKPTMEYIRNSGLVHLISISGLHLTLAAGIFFFSIRLILAQSEYLALHFNIKKIGAIFAIISSYFYLKIAGSPVPAMRSFIAVLFVMLAILFDRKIDSLRVVVAGAFIVLFTNPYNIFSVSFQLSFAAILSLIAFHELWSNSTLRPSIDTKFGCTSNYFLEMILMSCMAQLASMPFLIYYFNDVSIYGALSNIIAIPLTSFATMPLGFLSFFLMPFGLEKIALIPMGATISWVTDIAKFVSNLNNSHFYVPQMPFYGLLLATFGGLIFCFSTNKLKPLGALIFLASLITISFVKQPDILIDNESKFFAFYDKNNGLVFSKNMKSDSRKVNLWLEKMNKNKFESFDDYNAQTLENKGLYCDEFLCEINLGKYFSDKKEFKNKKMLVLFSRVELSEICDKNFAVIINLTKKYQLPKCGESEIRVDNIDLLKKGVHFIYFNDGKVKIKTAW